jgi:predicted glycoside hydrolase/deacetylase ChbG (UPF0249 family)
MDTDTDYMGAPTSCQTKHSCLSHNAENVKPLHRPVQKSRPGSLIINADDWGRDADTTDRALHCICRGTVSSVSAMVFMGDSERAATIARERALDAGLHLNFTAPLTGSGCSSLLVTHHCRVAKYLLQHRFAQVVFHPGLARSFEYVVSTQIDDFRRLYGVVPARLDGHHHMHLCANVVGQNLIPRGSLVRRNFSFQSREKKFINRFYRKFVDRRLAQRYRMVDFLFSLPPLEPTHRLQRIYSLARQYVVELETHPVNPEEYRFLTGDGIFRQLGDVTIATEFSALVAGGD